MIKIETQCGYVEHNFKNVRDAKNLISNLGQVTIFDAF